MKKSVWPSEIHGEIDAPASKSAMQRALALALLSRQPSRITNPAFCSDGLAAMRVVERLGGNLRRFSDAVEIMGRTKPKGGELHCGESGLCLRMFTAVAALEDSEFRLTGDESLLRRPVSMVEEPVKKLGAECRTNRGLPPVHVKGPLQGGRAVIDGSISSQFVSGLLLALPLAPRDSRLTVHGLTSIPYVDLTLRLMEKAGVKINHENHKTFFISGNREYALGTMRIPGDWSGAAFWLAAGAVSGPVTVNGLDPRSPQGDRMIIRALRAAGAEVRILTNAVRIRRGELKGFDFDVRGCPDLVPPLTVAACFCRGRTVLRGIRRLRYKESDRPQALFRAFRDLGADIRVQGDEMIIRGGELNGGEVDAVGDHRIAMALAVAAVHAREKVVIRSGDSVVKSYPGFYRDLAKLGGRVDE